jgi:hypothetical protein
MVCVVFMLVCGLPAKADEEVRTWTDASGKYKIEARYIGTTGTKITLERPNGKRTEIEVKQLSAGDQKYVESLTANNPFKPAKEDNAEEPAEDAKPQTVSVDWSASEAIRLESPGTEWTATVAPHPGWGAKPKTVTLPAKIDFFEGMNGMAVNGAARKAVVCFHLGRGENDSKLRLVTCDLTAGKTGPIATAQAQMAPLALDNDGNRVLMRRDAFGFGNHEKLELWTIKGKTVRRTLSWTAYDDSWAPNRDVNWAEFVDADHVLTASANGKIVLWNLKNAQPLWHFETTGGATPCLSGDRKTLGFCTNNRVGLFDLATRKVIALASIPRPLTWPITAFSPTGKRMACIAQNRILVWDTRNGKVLADFDTPGINLAGGIGFPDDNFLLCGNRFIIELENHLKLWEYNGAERVQTVGNLTVAALAAPNAPGALLTLELPHKEARDLLAKALARSDIFVFREGTRVKLDVQGVPAGDRDHVRDVLTQKLAGMKCPIADDGTISLVANVTAPKERTMSFMHAGDYRVTEYFSELRFVYHGNAAWFASGSNISNVLTVRRGENVEGILRQASAKPNIGFYDGAVLPNYIQNPSLGQAAAGRQTIGASQITASGLQ